MKNLFAVLMLAVTSLAGFGGCVATVDTPGVEVHVPAPFVWVGPGYYGGAYYRTYPGPGYHNVGKHRHNWK